MSPSPAARTNAANTIAAAHAAAAGEALAGVPDLLLFADGRTFGLELKTTTGRLSGSQTALHRRLEAAGVTVSVVYGLNPALATLAQWNLLRP